jgi:peptidoglycan/xylan/chitin deacetylase (PgdA/CDA1 family)
VVEAQSRFHHSPFLQASIAAHAAGVLTVLAVPSSYLGVGAGLLLNHALIGAAGLWPRSRLLGPNVVRLPLWTPDDRHLALTFDDGPDPDVTPRLLDLLDEAQARATFFCIGRRVDAHPRLAAEIQARGHALANHTHTHPNRFALLGGSGIRREIENAQQALQAAAGVLPRFFRAPAGFRNPFLEPELHRLGLRLVSWSRRGFDTVTREAGRVVRRLERGLKPGDILLMHDGSSARDRQGRPVVVEALRQLLARVREQGLLAVRLDEVLGE